MKKLIFLTAILTLSSCLNTPSREVDTSEQSGRIKVTHVKSTGTEVFYIVEVDSAEFLVSDKGGISKIK